MRYLILYPSTAVHTVELAIKNISTEVGFFKTLETILHWSYISCIIDLLCAGVVCKVMKVKVAKPI